MKSDVYDSQPDPAAPWIEVRDAAPESVRRTVAVIVRGNAEEIAGRFYAHMLADPEAGPMLTHELVSRRLNRSLQAWMINLLSGDTAAAELIAQQEKVGVVHAHIGVPMHLVLSGVRLIKDHLAVALGMAPIDRDGVVHAMRYVNGLCDLAMERMSRAFKEGDERETRSDEAYRLFALGQNVAAERERQRAALVEWSHSVLVALHLRDKGDVMPLLSTSSFGLWLMHKGSVMFDGFPQMARIHDAVAMLDNHIARQLAQASDPAEFKARVVEFQALISEVKHLLSALFDHVAELEGGSDPLTQVLNRRFLPSIVRREINLALREKGSFAVLMLDLDHFKSINDTYGHDGGDKVLRQAAECLLRISRTSDFVFRYGGEEFIIVLVNAGADDAMDVAERIRRSIGEQVFHVRQGDPVHITISIGVAVFDGHPDYEYLLSRADVALYQAKAQGRNKAVLAS